jgi:O-phosphoseryl-tRNA(Cys) synthetase
MVYPFATSDSERVEKIREYLNQWKQNTIDKDSLITKIISVLEMS